MPDEARRSVEQRLRRALAPFGTRIQRASIRFDDVNGPRGGVDVRCAIKLVMAGSHSIIIEERADSVLAAVRRAMPRVSQAIRRFSDKTGRKTPKPTAALRRGTSRRAARPMPEPEPMQVPESLIDKRVGRSPANLEAALERPEKRRRAAHVDTAQHGVSATDRKAGGVFSARRNSKRNDAGMAYALEDSRGKPSRKSTRSSANRLKAATQLTRRAQRRVRSPQARATSSAG